MKVHFTTPTEIVNPFGFESQTDTHTQTQRMTQASNQFGNFTVKAVCKINFKACFGFVEQKATTTHYLSKPV